MTEVGGASELLQTSPDWNAALAMANGHLLQSWEWGQFKSRHGWEVERLAVRCGEHTAVAQILFRRRGPFSLAYIPRGPAFRDDDPASLERLFAEIDDVCRRHRAAHLIVETDRPLPFKGSFRSKGFVRGPEHFQPSRTVKVPLLDDEALLAQMHQKTRYSVRLAHRRGVEVRQEAPTPAAVASFYALLRDTSERNEFGVHSEVYYADFLRVFGDHALLLIAYIGNEPAASVISARFGKEAIYMYGASSTAHRAHGATYALQFEAMRWAREHGCERYDLWGIPHEDPVTAHADGTGVAGTKGDDWSGLHKFKVGFGGEIVTYPPTLERRYRPFISLAVRRFYANRGA